MASNCLSPAASMTSRPTSTNCSRSPSTGPLTSLSCSYYATSTTGNHARYGLELKPRAFVLLLSVALTLPPPYPTLPYPTLPYPTRKACSVSLRHLNGRTLLDSPPTLPYPTLPYPTLPTLPNATTLPCPTSHVCRPLPSAHFNILVSHTPGPLDDLLAPCPF